MTYEAAMKELQQGKCMRRASWSPSVSLRLDAAPKHYGPFTIFVQTGTTLMHVWQPSADDRAATDWEQKP